MSCGYPYYQPQPYTQPYTNVYVCNNPCQTQCKEESKPETCEKPNQSNQGHNAGTGNDSLLNNDVMDVDNNTSSKPSSKPKPRAGSNTTQSKPSTNTESKCPDEKAIPKTITRDEKVLETVKEGFEDDELGIPTFEEEEAANTPIFFPGGNRCQLAYTDCMQDFTEWEEEEIESTLPPKSTPANPVGPQGSPEYTIYSKSLVEMVNDSTDISQAVESVTNQGVDGNWMNWTGSEWDGNEIDPTTYTQSELCSWLRPTGSLYIIRGLRQKYIDTKPFADPTAPTPAEIDNWHVEVIRHFRDMFGNTTPISWNSRLSLECRWSDERKRTTVWDAKYSGTFGSAFGPCGVGDGNAHCGESFFPDAGDRAPYIAAAPFNNDFVTYPELENYTTRYSQAAGLASCDVDLPWSIKFASIVADWICSEYLSGHPGPFVSPTSARQEVGISWWYEAGDKIGMRVKWR